MHSFFFSKKIVYLDCMLGCNSIISIEASFCFVQQKNKSHEGVKIHYKLILTTTCPSSSVGRA